MYIPKQFENNDKKLLLEVMGAHSFAMLISAQENDEPFVSHLPLIVRERDDATIIEGHMARANPHWQYLERNPKALIVFNGPHVYVSPSLYRDKENVPTWNYVAVHAYGRIALEHDMSRKHAAQERMVDALEPVYHKQFDELSETYMHGRLSAIVAFEFVIERLEGKFKLSQNRPMYDRQSVLAAFTSGNDDQRAVASWMRRLAMGD